MKYGLAEASPGLSGPGNLLPGEDDTPERLEDALQWGKVYVELLIAHAMRLDQLLTRMQAEPTSQAMTDEQVALLRRIDHCYQRMDYYHQHEMRFLGEQSTG